MLPLTKKKTKGCREPLLLPFALLKENLLFPFVSPKTQANHLGMKVLYPAWQERKGHT